MNSNQDIAKIIAKFKAGNWNDAIAEANKTDLTDQYILVWKNGYISENAVSNFFTVMNIPKSRRAASAFSCGKELM